MPCLIGLMITGVINLCNLNLTIACDDGDVFLTQKTGDWESGSLRNIDQQNMRIETYKVVPPR
jgi:hypothetical protein